MGGYGGYGGSMYGGGYGGGYGGYGRGMYGAGGMYGGMPGNDPNSLANSFNQSTAATFQMLEGIVGAFGGFAQMLESTYMATHSSFYGTYPLACSHYLLPPPTTPFFPSMISTRTTPSRRQSREPATNIFEPLYSYDFGRRAVRQPP